MTSDEDIAAAVDHAVAEFGRLDMMVSNGRFHQQPSAVLHEAGRRT